MPYGNLQKSCTCLQVIKDLKYTYIYMKRHEQKQLNTNKYHLQVIQLAIVMILLSWIQNLHSSYQWKFINSFELQVAKVIGYYIVWILGDVDIYLLFHFFCSMICWGPFSKSHTFLLNTGCIYVNRRRKGSIWPECSI